MSKAELVHYVSGWIVSSEQAQSKIREPIAFADWNNRQLSIWASTSAVSHQLRRNTSVVSGVART